MSSILYKIICLTSYQKHTNPGNNPSYYKEETQAARESIKDSWESDQFDFVTRKNSQNSIKKQIIAVVFPEFIDEQKNPKKGFSVVLGHKFMEYLMFRYGKITEPIKDQGNAEFIED